MRCLAAVLLILTLIASSFLPAITSAQDASTPVAEPVEITPAPEPAPTDAAPQTDLVEPSPTPTNLPDPNTDSIIPFTQPIVIQPGQAIEPVIEYRITTNRLETGIHFELRTEANLEADDWGIEANGIGGFGAIDIADAQTEPGLMTIRLRIIAPDNAAHAETLTLLAYSIVRTTAGEFENGVPGETLIATVLVAAPEPAPADSTPPASPEPDEPIATATTEPADATPIPVSPEPETPASPQPETLFPAAPPETLVDLSSELTLIGRKPYDTVAIGDSRSVTLDYAYALGFARAGTTISAQAVNWNGAPMPGWSVQVNGVPDSYYDGEHLESGSTFDVTVTITVDETVDASTKARLLFTVTIAPTTTTEQPSAFTFAAESIQDPGPSEPLLSETFEGPMMRLDDGFSTSSVTSPNNGLTCFDPSASYPGGVAADSMIPGQIARFTCNLTLSGISLLPTFSGTATIQGANTAGWQIAASSQVSLIGESLLAPVGTYSTTSVSMSGFGVLSIAALLGAGGLSFSIYVKAPSLPLSLSPVNSVSITVNTYCEAALGASNCLGSIFGSRDATVTLSATVRDIQTTVSGGGALTDAGLLGSIGSLIGNGLVFRIYCDAPATGTQVEPQEIATIPCHILSLIDLSLLGSVASISADVSIAFTDPSANWKLNYNGSPVSGLVNIPLTTALNAGVLSASADFTVTLQYNPGACITTPFTGQPLNAVNLTADYHVLLLSSVEVGISDGWASVPVQLEGASTSPVGYTPLLSGSGISFGTYRFSGAAGSYTRISGSTPTLSVTLTPNGGANCSARPWYVTVQFSSLAGYQDAGHTIPLSASIAPEQISINGGPSGSYADTTTYTPSFSGSPSTIVQSTNTLLTSMVISYPMALTPPPASPVGYYLGTVTLTVVSGTPP